MFTVKQLSRLAGITPRTLHYYDEIGLLPPTEIGENSYRYYGEETLLRLQQILLYREMDLPLEQIRQILTAQNYDLLTALEEHKAELRKRITRLETISRTVEQTILYLKGKRIMDNRQFFRGFTPEEEAEYSEKAMQLYDPQIVKESNRKWKTYTSADKDRIMREGNAVYASYLAALPGGPSSPAAQLAVQQWRTHMSYFWTPNDEQLLGLAEGYVNDPQFRNNFDKIDPALAEFILEAVKVYLAARE